MSIEHYENFPVASMLLPARLRPAVRAIYRFARTADDLADEGDAQPTERLAALDRMGEMLDAIEAGGDGDWPDLAAAVHEHALPMAPFRALLSAFAQDVTVGRYADYEALLDYSRRSADPVGRLLLALYRVDDGESLARADAICSGLQFTNFWQDIAIDWRKGRVYLPQAEMARFELDETAIAEQRADARWSALMREQTGRARRMLQSGAPLAHRLPGRIGWELRLIVQGGLHILEAIDRVDGDVFRHRPELHKADWLRLGARAISMRSRP